MPVHLYGRPVDLAPLVALGIPIIEDAAQAHGALRSIAGAAAVYSFYPTKNLGGIGDGGAVATDDETLANAVRRLRVHGMTEQYVHVDISQNFRMSEIEAAFIRLQLARLDVDNSRRRAIARHYRLAAPNLRWHDDHPDHVFHLCVLRAVERDRMRAELDGGRGSDRGALSAGDHPAARLSVAGDAAVPCCRGLGGGDIDRSVRARADRRRGGDRRVRPRQLWPTDDGVSA